MSRHLDFASDNWAGASQPIIDAIIAANVGAAPAYFGDETTARMRRRFEELFGCRLTVIPVPTGTAANGLAIDILAGRAGVVAGMEEAHIYTKEGPARAFFNDRGVMLKLGGRNGKLAPADVDAAFAKLAAGPARRPMLSLTNGTDCGTVYTVDDVKALSAVARKHGAATHMDGARFANAVAALGCAPADLTWKAGVDVLSFGATKNGSLGVDAVVIFNPNGDRKAWIEHAEQAVDTFGYVFSKARFASAQLDAMIADGHWLDLARRANASADKLARGILSVPGVRLAFPREINEVFAILPPTIDDAMRAGGARYHAWPWTPNAIPADIAPRGNERLVRMLTSFQTRDDDVERLIALARSSVTARAAE